MDAIFSYMYLYVQQGRDLPFTSANFLLWEEYVISQKEVNIKGYGGCHSANVFPNVWKLELSGAVCSSNGDI